MGGTEIRERGIEYHPLPSQRRFHDSRARFKGFSGPIGSGKSQALCQEALRLTYLNPGRTGLLGAPTFPMLRDATQAALLEILERNRIPHEWNRAENFLVLRETGSRILFRAVEEFQRLRGSNLAWFGLDELTYAPQQAWLRLEGRLRDPRAKRLCGFAVWTPKGYDWVYFPNDGLGTDYSGMPFYDAWNLATFAAAYGRAMATITVNTVDPAAYPDEAAYFPTAIGNFTAAIMSFVRATQAGCRFEVLYPTDVNQTAFNRAINYPAAAWTPAALTCLKTEAFGFTYGRNLDMSWATLDFGDALGFAATQRSHLLGVGDSTTAWLKEVRAAEGKRFESVVLFAIDQFSLIGYEVPLPDGLRRSFRVGG
ncbi:MAG: hypothetical protein M3N41_10935 [Acidobacteriota bacterium]|nr:hypothetical protein [Acidobacteriota bacterium]